MQQNFDGILTIIKNILSKKIFPEGGLINLKFPSFLHIII